MYKFLKKLLVFSLFPIAIVIGVIYYADGKTDPYYIRFTTPVQKNLILGTSRAAQGLQPEVFKKELNIEISNYAFTIFDSPFGSVYHESIKRKHSKENGGVFIVTVDPWSISSWCKNPNDLSLFRDNEFSLNNTKIVDLNPNFIYLYQNYKGKYHDILLNSNHTAYLHDDGWLEIMDIAMDSISIAHRIEKKVKSYRETHLPKTRFSSIRLAYLLKTIRYLKKYGVVYLVRLPIHHDLMTIEDELMPNFDQIIREAIEDSNGYLDLTKYNDTFQYTDGNHLYKPSGQDVSVRIADWIKERKVTTSNSNEMF